jgi:glycine/D-amino acid oxidase-like deaminating enzyme
MSKSQSGDGYDLIVVGGGIFGLSVAWEAGRRGRRTLVVERRSIPNPIAASYGPSRKIRSTYLDPHYARLAHEAMSAWRAVEAELGAELYVPVGNLSFTSLDEQPRLDGLKTVAESVGSAVRDLDERAMRAEFPQFRRARRGLLETQAGFLRATACVEALRTLALRQEVVFASEREVESIEPGGDGPVVRTAAETYRAPQVVLAGGGWSNRLLPELGRSLWQCQQGIVYLQGVPQAFSRPAFVPFSCLDNGYYGFPSELGVGLKIAQHVLGEPLADPDFDRSTTPPGFVEGTEHFLRDELGLNLADYPVTYDSCMYNLSRSNDFLLDFHPELPGLFVATAGSGHGFKFGSIMGRIVLDRLDGVPSDRWAPQFSYESFLAAPPTPRPL